MNVLKKTEIPTEVKSSFTLTSTPPKIEIDKKEKSVRKKLPYYGYFNNALTDTFETTNDNLTEQKNEYYVPAFVEYLLKEYMAYYPLWSAINLKQFNLTRDSNTAVENWFKIVKHYIFEMKMKQKIARFMQKMESLIIVKIKARIFELKPIRQFNNLFRAETKKTPIIK